MYFQYRKLYPFIYYFSNFTHSYTFGWKRYPIDILLRWKSYPFIYLDAWKSSRTSVYTFIMEVNPPPSPSDCQHHHRVQGWLVSRVSSILPPPPPPYTGKSEGMGLAVRRYLYLQCILSYCQVHIFPCRAPLPGGKVHTQDSSYPWTL